MISFEVVPTLVEMSLRKLKMKHEVMISFEVVPILVEY